MLVASRHLRRRSFRRDITPAQGGAARRGFSLLEMLVVLAILAALTLIAVQSLGPVEQQARNFTTQKTLDGVKAAILSMNSSAGTQVASGFVADMGHLPDMTSAVTFANDLLNNNPFYGTDRTLFGALPGQPYGWRGAYLQTATTTTLLLDGWNQPLSVYLCDYSGAPIVTLSSPSDRIVISSPGSPVESSGPISTTITYGSLTAMPLTVRVCALDDMNVRTTLTGTVSLTLRGGLSATTAGTLAETALTTSVTGSNNAFAFYPTPAQLLVGGRELIVTFTADATMTGFTINDNQTFHLNLLPGTSPTQEVIVARQQN